MHLKNWELTQARDGRNRGCGVVVEAYTAKRRLQLQHTPGSSRGGSGRAKKSDFSGNEHKRNRRVSRVGCRTILNFCLICVPAQASAECRPRSGGEAAPMRPKAPSAP